MKRLLLVLTFVLVLAATAGADTFTSGASWYGGPCDHADNNLSASGIPNTIPGIARFNRRTLGRFYLLTDLRTHRRVVVVQSDVGPAPWVRLKPTETGWPIRVDVNYSAASAVGYRAPGGCVMGWRYGERIRLTGLTRRLASRWARRTATELDSHWIWWSTG